MDGSCEHDMNLLIAENVGKFLSGCSTGSFSTRAKFHIISYLYFNVILRQTESSLKVFKTKILYAIFISLRRVL
jgi:hypothetical protein